MKGSTLVWLDPQGNMLAAVTRSANRLYKTPIEIYTNRCLRVESDDLSQTWHARLGHVSQGVMKNMADKKMVEGMPQITHGEDVCKTCQVGKQTRGTFPTKSTYRAAKALELVHGDLCGPISPPTPSKKRYIFVLIDDYSRYMWSLLLHEKSEAYENFKKFKVYVEAQSKNTIKSLRTDRGGEFTSLEFNRFCEDNGIH